MGPEFYKVIDYFHSFRYNDSMQKKTTALALTIIALISAALFFMNCTSSDRPQENMANRNQKNRQDISYIENMTLREKLGQMFFVVPEAFDLTLTQTEIDKVKTKSSSVLLDEMKINLQKYPAGGICFFAKNIDTPEQVKKYISDLQEASSIPLFIAVDEEGGRVARIARNKNFNVTTISSALKIGSTNNPCNAYDMGLTIGTYLQELGFNTDFAPVADIWTNPENRIIGDRAFSTTPDEAGSMIKACIEGFHGTKTFTTVKHFPGHGDTSDDSHTGSVYTYKTWEELKACEMIPFASGINAGTDFIMVGHIKTPNATDDNLPATLSGTWITDRLKGEMNFTGLVITDAMGMKAISGYYSPVQAAEMAIEAGADIILMPPDYTKVFEEILAAIGEGKISEERINQSVNKILKLKRNFMPKDF